MPASSFRSIARTLVPSPVRSLLRRRGQVVSEGNAEVKKGYLRLLKERGYLEGYSVPPNEVSRLVRVKRDDGGEPVRPESFTRRELGMKDLEYLFAIQAISDYVPKGNSVIDIASGSSLLPLFLAAMGYQAFQHDVNRSHLLYPGLEQITCDVMDLGRKCQGEYFSGVTLICALEHFGLGRYGDRLDGRGDFAAVAAIRQALKVGGVVVATIPFGPPAIVFNTHRVYNYGRIAQVFSGFELLREEYRLWPDWVATTRDVAADIKLNSQGKRLGKNHSLALVVYRKTG